MLFNDIHICQGWPTGRLRLMLYWICKISKEKIFQPIVHKILLWYCEVLN